MPKVSVIIPVYGVEQYIERCARSLFEQNMDDIEYLFIDDCTPDMSVEVLKSVLEEYPNRKDQVIIHRMKQNSGQAAVRKWGILNATGEYIIHCDSDDWTDVKMYETLYKIAKTDNADVVVCDFYTSDRYQHEYHKGLEATSREEVLSSFYQRKIPTTLWNKLVKRDLFLKEGFVFPEHNMGEDIVLITQALYFSTNISYVKEPLYYYYENPNSISNIQTEEGAYKKYSDAISNAAIVRDFYRTQECPDIVRDALVVYYYYEKRLLLPLIEFKRSYRKQWYDTFSELNKEILFCPLLSFKEKIIYYATSLRLYPVKKRIMN